MNEKIKSVFQELSRWIFLVITIIFLVEGLYKISISLITRLYTIATFSMGLIMVLTFFTGLSMVILGAYCSKLCMNYFRYREIPSKKFTIFLIVFSILTSKYAFVLSLVLLICIIVSTTIT